MSLNLFSRVFIKSTIIVGLLCFMLLTSLLMNSDVRTAHAAPLDTATLRTLATEFLREYKDMPPNDFRHQSALTRQQPSSDESLHKTLSDTPTSYILVSANTADTSQQQPPVDYKSTSNYIVGQTITRMILACFPGQFITAAFTFVAQRLTYRAIMQEAVIAFLAFLGITIETGGADLLLAGGAFIALSSVVVACFGAIPFYASQAAADTLWDWIAKGWNGDVNNHPPVPGTAIDDLKNGIKVNPMQLCQGVGGTWKTEQNSCYIPPQVLKKSSNDTGSGPAFAAAQSCDSTALQGVYPFATASYNQDNGACTIQMDFAAADVSQIIAVAEGDGTPIASSDVPSDTSADTTPIASSDTSYYTSESGSISYKRTVAR